jgi:large subunit ribosomal protein L22
MSNVLVKASARSLRVSPQKLNLVAESIRKMKVSEALVQLSFSPKRIAIDVKTF